MAGGFKTDAEQIRKHAANVAAIQARFGAVKSASGHIAQDDQAYGLLCGWISGVLEGKHAKQDELIAYVEENLALVVKALGDTATAYEAIEDSNASMITAAGGMR
ncbi:hypothetical protein [Actinokineospora xionganensis]|uniref:Excreted virulence factor EspC (Type VII ESX diderm) n=1 Tax=Actinokineospora xionganensis TaxID=2684470 RepID=A0ABR7L366_9PSEU|nr:hypothetical protein [Actinokineospora xionganensis]MBC6447136.1 hypothetical protein [Actinokineospora xionganensis]